MNFRRIKALSRGTGRKERRAIFALLIGRTFQIVKMEISRTDRRNVIVVLFFGANAGSYGYVIIIML